MENNLLSVTEFAEMHSVDCGNVRRYLSQGRIAGFKIGNQWVIPADAELPSDNRVKTGKYIKQKD